MLRWTSSYWEVLIRIRSGSHNYGGLTVVDDGIVSDVSGMERIEVDCNRGIATLQAGQQDISFQNAWV